jgi:hypothetical protein
MTELQIYKFVHENELEWHWYGDDVVLFIDFELISNFAKMVKNYILCHDSEYNATLKEDCIAVCMSDVFDYYGIFLEKVFNKS